MKASDLHLKSATQPMLRVDGSMVLMPNRAPIQPPELQLLLETIMPERNRAEYRDTNDTDFAYELMDRTGGTLRARMRCNVFRDIVGIGAVFRQIPSKILTAEDLRLPKACLDFCQYDKGLVVVTGPTGSGKSTTLAAMIDWINANRDDHIITIEDPVEFVHKDKKCLINQREVGTQTKSFKAALRAALREDPDIVLVGEMRDLETVAIAIETAETGHLVFGTLHTNTAPSTVDRLIDQFPTDRQEQIRAMLSESLKGVVAQTLLKKKGGGRVAALEILIVTHAVSNLIREGKTFQIPSLMQTGKGIGMQTLNDSLMDLVKRDVVDAEEAYDRAPNKKEFGSQLTRAGITGPWSAEDKPGH
jgi:twitching motility protein PilT